MTKTIRDLLWLLFITLALTILMWLPHLLRINNLAGLNFSEGFATIYRNYDGLEYVVISKTFYKPGLLALIPQNTPASYFAAHFPGYSLVILLFAPFLGFLKSMLFSSLLFTVLSTWIFYLLVKQFKLTGHPLLLSSLFLVLPARWLIVHSVGSSEPMFIFFVITTIYSLMRYELVNKWRWIWIASLSGLGAQITRPPGILLLGSIGLYLLWRHRFNLTQYFKFLPLILMPLTLLGMFLWYQYSLNDFWAYFHSGDNIHLVFPPFQIFNKFQFWVGEIWLEDVIYIFILGLLGGLLLFKKNLKLMAFFVLTYLAASMFVTHRDIARYTLPVFPFLLIAFEKVLTMKEFKVVMIIVALAIYLYAQNFILNNTAPIPHLEILN